MNRYAMMLSASLSFLLAQDVNLPADSTLGSQEITLSLSVSDTNQIVAAQVDSSYDSTQIPLPEFIPDYPPPSQLQTGEHFFEYQNDIEFLQAQIDSLKKLVRVYSKKDTMPEVQKALIDLLNKIKYSHRITLENGTVVRGQILNKTEDKIILDTDIGRLVLDKDFVTKIEKELPKTAKIELEGEPSIDLFPDRDVMTGRVKNIGEKRGDFVRVIANLWGKDTALISRDSSFVNGTVIQYNSGVITDTSIEPGESALFKVTIRFPAGSEVSYRTFDIRWEDVE